jgi:uncharacterized protein YqgV (UPF0045/DUF77 family)
VHDLLAEFTIEPFEPSTPGPHVRAAIDAAEAVDGVEVEVGPFGTSVTGPSDLVLDLLRVVSDAAIANGATRLSIQVTLA